MRNSLLLEQIKKYVDKNNLIELKDNIEKWESMKDWHLDIGKKVNIFGEGKGEIVETPNFSILFVKMDNNYNNELLAIRQSERNIRWSFVNE